MGGKRGTPLGRKRGTPFSFAVLCALHLFYFEPRRFYIFYQTGFTGLTGFIVAFSVSRWNWKNNQPAAERLVVTLSYVYLEHLGPTVYVPWLSLLYITFQLRNNITLYLIKNIKKGDSLTFLYAIRQMNVVRECFQLLMVRGSVPAWYQIVSFVHIVESIMPIFPHKYFFKVEDRTILKGYTSADETGISVFIIFCINAYSLYQPFLGKKGDAL